MANKRRKRCSTLHQGNANRNEIHLLEWPKFKTITPPNAGMEVEQQELSFIASGNAEWYRHFGRKFGSFLQN